MLTNLQEDKMIKARNLRMAPTRIYEDLRDIINGFLVEIKKITRSNK